MTTCALWQFESIPGVEDRELIGTSTLRGRVIVVVEIVVVVVVDRDRELIGTSALWGTSDRQALPCMY